MRPGWRELVISQLPITPIRIIDMGGGTGSISELLAEAGHQVTYVDSSIEITKLAKQKCQRVDDLPQTLKTWHSLLNDRGYFVSLE